MRYSRQNKILEIINTNEVEAQDRLQELLREAGYNVTQATISRDIKELQLVKGLSKSGKYKYVSSNYQERPISDRFIKIFRETTLSWASAENLIIVKTLSGCGNAAAEAIDCLELEHIVGTISGDNTMLIVVDKSEHVKNVTDKFEKMINKKED
ncbi:MAG: arginine repressor [Clostridiales bacterium]|nr:arginine repressor [Candidatus Crickella merdequi]